MLWWEEKGEREKSLCTLKKGKKNLYIPYIKFTLHIQKAVIDEREHPQADLQEFRMKIKI